MIEAVNDAFQLPEKGLVGPHAIFDPAMLRTPEIDDAFLAQQDVEPPIAEPPAFPGKLAHPLPQQVIVRAPGAIPDH